MAPQGTAACDGRTDLPPLVERAVSAARRAGFANSCRALVAIRRFPSSPPSP